jgi:hypothetical protein
MTALARRIADLERGSVALTALSREEIWREGCEALARLHMTFPVELGRYAPQPMPADFAPALAGADPALRRAAARALIAEVFGEGSGDG